ncbi:MAG TPA: hypothetical protein VFN62_08205, partial [Acidobacteriaceae bacterium]|nr:hypothetical protein [Acidobacteriaceae bacterium]
AQGPMAAYTRVICSLPNPRKDGKICQALSLYSEALAACENVSVKIGHSRPGERGAVAVKK